MTWVGVSVRLVLIAAIVAGALVGARWFYRAGYAAAAADCAQREATAAESARLADRARLVTQMDANGRIDHDTNQALRAAQARAAAARADADGLRHALDALRADRADADTTTASCDLLRRQRDGLADLLAEGGELLAQGQEAGDRLAAANAGLRRYIPEVCRVPLN